MDAAKGRQPAISTLVAQDARTGTARGCEQRTARAVPAALANKNVRTVWAILAHGREFKADYVPTRMAA